ncbi:MAG: hypothetical protein K0Q99_1932 [Clostridia bacterium]|jgi:hypothetical protein|nr:hypothetical protein [Clostridia bacterium]
MGIVDKKDICRESLGYLPSGGIRHYLIVELTQEQLPEIHKLG